jgi:hypothetical protein
MKISAARKAQFCEAMFKGHTPEGAARAIGVSRRTAYNWKAAAAAFAAQWDEVREIKVENVDTMLYRMAMEKDLGACTAFLKACRPEVYNRKRVVAIGGDPGASPVTVEHRAMIWPIQARPQIEGDAEPEPLDMPVILPPSKKVA